MDRKEQNKRNGRPSATVITICYNCEETIAKTMESVLAQTHRPLEYLIIDGASTDKTVEIARSYVESCEEAGIDLKIFSEPDEGIYDAMNKGVKRASGEIVGILNAGDWYEPDAVKTSARVFAKTGCDLTFANICIHRTDGSVLTKRAVTRKGYQTSRDWNHPTMFVKTALSQENPYEKKGIHDDYAFYLKMVKKGVKIKTIDRTLAHFVMGGASNKKSLKASVKRIGDRYRYCYRDNGYSPLYLAECVAMEAAKWFL